MEFTRKRLPINWWKYLVLLVVWGVTGTLGYATGTNKGTDLPEPNGNESGVWVEEKLSRMSIRQKIGQLMMVPVFALADTADAQVLRWLQDYEVGGLIWMKGKTPNLGRLRQLYTSERPVPLWMAMDAEWGAAMRLDDRSRFPYAMTMGACRDTLLVEALAEAMGKELRELGMHISFGPVADVNSNPFNPVIGFRSFGSQADEVLALAKAYARGLEKAGIMSCAKHFPGHGDTDLDSHHDLPVLNKERSRLDSTELKTFWGLRNLPSMMSAHVMVQALDGGLGLPVSLNPNALEGLLRREWGYGGVIFSDALNMKGASECYPSGELEWKALQAGNDVLLYVTDVPKAVQRIEKALNNGDWTEAELDQKVRRILSAKYRYVIQKSKISAEKSVQENPSFIQKHCYNKAITVLSTSSAPLPVLKPETKRLYLALGGDRAIEAYQSFGVYAQADYIHWPWKSSKEPTLVGVPSGKGSLDSLLATYPEWVVAWHLPSQRWSNNLGMDSSRLARWNALLSMARGRGVRMVHLLFGNPLALTRMQVKEPVLCVFEDRPDAYTAALHVLFGVADAPGHLPSPIPARVGDGNDSDSLQRDGRDQVLRWQPRLGNENKKGNAVLSARCLSKADSMVEAARLQGAFPGAQLLVAQGEQILWAKAYGHTDTSGDVLVDMGHVYDLASLTKVLSTGLAAMHLHSRRPLPLQTPLGQLLPELKNHPLGERKLSSLLTHQTGLASHIPFQTLLGQNQALAQRWSMAQGNPIVLRDSLQKRILALPMDQEGTYRYSDLGLLWFEQWLQNEYRSRYGQDYRSFLAKAWYEPCGATRLRFQPTTTMDLWRIAPTEYDTIWRKSLVHGRVHDPMAELMGGVAPHAGLFGTASDVARVMMPLITGYFPGSARVDPATVSRFTSPYNTGNRRGLLWDKPLTGSTQAAAPRSFGHSGFTGPYVWADLETGLILVFLSNRIHPNAEPNRLARSNLRTDLWDLFYREVQRSMRDSLTNP
ncbi:MAG: glycoside hydrolase family 3 N-terminal domain-containing protein [Bacteroidia bacterium]